MREKATGGMVRATRAARGAVRKTSATFIVLTYLIVLLTGVPIVGQSFLAGNFFVGSRVLGLLGIVLGVSATLIRVDALDRRSMDTEEDEALPTVSDGGQLTDASFRERFYLEYVLEGDRFKRVEYAFYGIGVLFMAISFILIA